MINRILFLFLSILFLCYCNNKDEYKYQNLKYSDKKIFPDHVVSDTLTAVTIAESIFISKYGKKILKQRPYQIKIEKGIDTIWNIKGIRFISKDPALIWVGGLAHISIRSKDCKVLELYHTR